MTRRPVAYVTASAIAAAGMMSGHALAAAARASGQESPFAQAVGILAWIAAGVTAVVIDRTVVAPTVAAASVALPLLWFATLDNPLWLLGLAALALFAILAGVSAALTKLAFRAAGRA
jgi:hypothetical protein